MKKILILGGTGMLGSAAARYFARQSEYETVATYRTDGLEIPCGAVRFDALRDVPDSLGGGYDYVLNCIGVIKPFMAADMAAAIRINAVFPRDLARWCEKRGAKLIHITTDCVYSGQKGRYVEADPHDAPDEYGKSKSLGECPAQAMVLRTSIIGEEIHKHASLVAWAKSQRGKEVSGFSTHLWNGVTTGEYARICDKIMRNRWFEKGLFHVFAKDDVSKLAMLRWLDEKYDLRMTVAEARPPACDRTLRTEKDLCAKLEIPTVSQMIGAM